MSDTITIGKRLIDLGQIALIEPFDPAANPRVQSEKAFKSRVVLTDRESVLSETEPFAFAEQHAFRMLLEDNVAVNPAISTFGVEIFEPAAEFQPTRPFRSRLIWKDAEGNTQSKLLLTAPEIALAVVVRGEAQKVADSEPASEQPGGRRRRRRQQSPVPA